jgi:hypothetical protein
MWCPPQADFRSPAKAGHYIPEIASREIALKLGPTAEGGAMSEKQVLANQKKILQNQTKVLANQQAIKANQASILANQKKLDRVLANQKTIEANQKKILANQAKLLGRS